MKRLIVSVLLVIGMATVAAPSKESPKELKVLMIGNSFSICVLEEMPQIAKSMGYKLDLVSLFIGGCSLEKHWNNVCMPESAPYRMSWSYDGVKGAKDAPVAKYLRDTMMYNNKTKKNDIPGKGVNIPEILQAEKWNVVTIQQASHFSWQPATYHPWGDDLVKKIRELAPQAEIIVQETWSYTPWDRRLNRFGIDQNTMYSALHAAYDDFARGHKFRVIPMGTAVQEYRKRLPVAYTENSFGGDVTGSAKFEQDKNGKWVPKGDVFHLNRSGHYLQGLVWTAKLFGADVTKCEYRPTFVSEDNAMLMRECAMSAVKSSR